MDSTPPGTEESVTLDGAPFGDASNPDGPEGLPPPMPPRENPDDGDTLGGGGSPLPMPAATVRASDRRPQVEALRAQQLAAGDFDDLSSLEAEAKRLESLARELESRAKALESKVRELE